MENITPNYVNFEVAKLLKEKGFDEECNNCYNLHGCEFINGWCEYILDVPFTNKDIKNTDFLAPEISLVVKWLYLKHNIWISVYNEQLFFGYDVVNSKKKTSYGNLLYRNYPFDTPEQAYLEAIKYTLTKLI